MTALARQAQRNAISNAIGVPDRSPVKNAILLENAGIEREEIQDVALAVGKQRRVSNLLDASSNLGQSSNNKQDSSQNNKNGVNIANNAIDAYIKQTLFFSQLDRVSDSINVRA